jgi:hypothetical protein
MARFTHHLQIAIDESRKFQVAYDAKVAGISMGEFVRRAIDKALEQQERRGKQREFLKWLDAQQPINFGPPEELRRLREEAGMRQLFFDEEARES